MIIKAKMNASEQKEPLIPIENSLAKQWLTKLCRIIKPKEGFSAFLNVVGSVNEAAGVVFKNASMGTCKIGLMLKQTNSFVSLMGLLSHTQWWLCETVESPYEKVSMLCFTALKCMKCSFFICEMRGLDIPKIYLLKGRLPLIDLVSNILGTLGNAFNLMDNSEKWKKASVQTESNIASLRTLQKRKNKRKNSAEIRKWTMIIKHDMIAKHKLWMTIALDVANVALSFLTLIGTGAIKPLIDVNAKYMIPLNVALSSFWLYKCYYEENYREINIYGLK